MPGSVSARPSHGTRSCGGSANQQSTRTVPSGYPGVERGADLAGGSQPSSLPRTTTTGQNALVTQWMLTEPSSIPVNAPWPR
jgi:hypothetical protein